VLIEDAHQGAGLGTRFLGHVERTAVLLHMVDATDPDAGKAYRTVRHELEAYGAGLAEKPEIVALNKVDAVSAEDLAKVKRKLARAAGRPPLVMSAATGRGVREALAAVLSVLDGGRAVEREALTRDDDWDPAHG
jgi:GTP-binding protein